MLIIPVENKPDWRHPPVVTVLVTLVNVWVYFAFVGADEEALADTFQSYVANQLIVREAEFVGHRDAVTWIRWGLTPGDASWLTSLTSMFLHGGIDHLFGNMAFLFLFGFALERAIGAVSALMGGYLAVYQLHRIRFFYSVLVYFGDFRAPALVILPAWILKEVYGYAYGDEGIAN